MFRKRPLERLRQGTEALAHLVGDEPGELGHEAPAARLGPGRQEREAAHAIGQVLRPFRADHFAEIALRGDGHGGPAPRPEPQPRGQLPVGLGAARLGFQVVEDFLRPTARDLAVLGLEENPLVPAPVEVVAYLGLERPVEGRALLCESLRPGALGARGGGGPTRP